MTKKFVATSIDNHNDTPPPAINDEQDVALPPDELDAGDPDTPGMYVPAPVTGGNSALMTSNIDGIDIRPPWMAVAHGVGKLAKAGFNPGDLVLAGEHLITAKGGKLSAVIISANIYWKEYLSQEAFQNNQRPRIFRSDKEAEAAGLTTRWSADGHGPQCSPALELRLLIEKPKDLVCGLFGLEIDGKQFAPALMSLDKKAYWTSGAPIVQTARYSLRTRGFMSATWELWTSYEASKNSKNSAWVPRFRLSGYNSDGFINAAKTALGVENTAAI